MAVKLSDEQLVFLEQISKITIEIGNAYNELYKLELKGDSLKLIFQEYLGKLMGLLNLEKNLYENIPYDDWVSPILSFINRSFNSSSGTYITDEVMADYSKYQEIKFQLTDDSDDLWEGFKDALKVRIVSKLSNVLVSSRDDDNNSLVIATIEREAKAKLFTILDSTIKESPVSRAKVFTFVKYALAIRSQISEEVLINNNFFVKSFQCGEEFMTLSESEMTSKIIFACIKQVLEHLDLFTDEMYENFVTSVLARVDCLFLRSYLILLDEESKIKLEEQFQSLIEDTKDRSNKIKSKALIKRVFDGYQKDHSQYFGNV